MEYFDPRQVQLTEFNLHNERCTYSCCFWQTFLDDVYLTIGREGVIQSVNDAAGT
jgi:hypothetical protein